MKYLAALLIATSLASMPTLTGCDKTVSHTEETKTQPNGAVQHKEDTVTKDPNTGQTTETKTKTTDKP